MSPKLYFIGNVFNGSDESKSTEPRGFGFTNTQKRECELAGLPIRIEHNDELAVGKICKSWYSDSTNQRWILGEIERTDLKGKYAANGVKNNLYGGLSLQHLSIQLSDGSNVMVPVEVSIVEKPRRENCNIVSFTASAASTDNSKYLRENYSKYKLCKFIIDMSTSSAKITTHEASAVEAAVAAVTAPIAEPQVTPSAQADYEPNVDDLCKMVLELQNDKDALTTRVEQSQLKITQLEDEKNTEKQLKLQEDIGKAETLRQSIVEWCADNDMDLTEETKEKLSILANEHPELGNVVFQITHKASQKCMDLKKEVANAAKHDKDRQIKERVKEVYNQQLQSRGPVTISTRVEPPQSTINVYEASNRAKRKAPSDVYKVQNEQLLHTLKRARVGSARDNMNQIYAALKDRF